jgi:hypothetical protein
MQMKKGSMPRFFLLFIVLVVLVSVSGGILVRAQEAVGGEETLSQSDSPFAPKSADQAAQSSGSAISAPGEDVNSPATDLTAKSSAIDMPVNGAPVDDSLIAGADSVDLNAPNVSTKYFIAAGAVYVPWSNTMSWGYGGAGCLAPTTTGFWRSGVYIPDNSIMKTFYFGYYNSASSTASTGYLYRYTYTGDAVVVAQLNSQPGTYHTGYHYVAVGFTNLPVDNYNNAYAFAWSGSGNQQLCYMQVGYTPYNAFGLAMPSVLKTP